MEGKQIADYRSPDGGFTYTVSESAGFYVLYQEGVERLADAQHLKATLQDLSRKLGRRYALLMPLPEKFSDVAPEARKTMADAVLGNDSPLSKFAIFGGTFVMRALFNMYGRISKVPLRLFATQAEAEAWLKA